MALVQRKQMPSLLSQSGAVRIASSTSGRQQKPLERVKVVIRIRPMLGTDAGFACIQQNPIKPGSVVTPRYLNDKSSEVIEHKFDRVYGPDAKQADLFDSEIAKVLSGSLNGINTTIFAYGNTGAGKTHTMQGTEQDYGIIPRAVQELLASMQRDTLQNKAVYKMTISMLEIYNEKVYDLLELKDTDLPVREDANRQIFVPSLAAAAIESMSDFWECYRRGNTNRSTAETKLNATSSRSHSIVLLRITRRDAQCVLSSKVHLIDLAGSEDNRKTGNIGQRLLESSSINSSLFVLNKVVNALNNKEARIPYRDSKLTRFLSDSLGGKAQSVLIANVAPSSQYFSDSMNTISFASRSKVISTQAETNCTFISPMKMLMDKKKESENVENAAFDRAERLREWQEKQGKKRAREEKDAGSTDAVGPSKKVISAPMRGSAPLLPVTSKSQQPPAQPKPRPQEKANANAKANAKECKRRLIVYDSDESGSECAENDPDWVEESQTPISRLHAAQSILEKARREEALGHLTLALELYESAQILLPNHSRLAHCIGRVRSQATKAAGVVSYQGGTDDMDMDSDMPLRPDVEIDEEEREAKLLDILNTGDVKALMQLATIGKKRADQIKAWRERKPFSSVEELTTLLGFSEKSLQKLRASSVDG